MIDIYEVLRGFISKQNSNEVNISSVREFCRMKVTENIFHVNVKSTFLYIYLNCIQRYYNWQTHLTRLLWPTLLQLPARIVELSTKQTHLLTPMTDPIIRGYKDPGLKAPYAIMISSTKFQTRSTCRRGLFSLSHQNPYTWCTIQFVRKCVSTFTFLFAIQ